MKKKVIQDIENKKAIWFTISDLYLDSELDDFDFKRIALDIYNSSFSIKKVIEIDKYDVFPVLIYNLLSVAGIWGSFEKESLNNAIIKNLEYRNFVTKIFLEFFYLIFKGINKDSWKKIEKEYSNLKEKQ